MQCSLGPHLNGHVRGQGPLPRAAPLQFMHRQHVLKVLSRAAATESSKASHKYSCTEQHTLPPAVMACETPSKLLCNFLTTNSAEPHDMHMQAHEAEDSVQQGLSQHSGSRRTLEFMGAWSDLASRLPSLAGPGSALILNALKLAVACGRPLTSPLNQAEQEPEPWGAAQLAGSLSAAQASNLRSGTPAQANAAGARQLQGPSTAQGSFGDAPAAALDIALQLADLAAHGLPLDGESIAAGMLMDCVEQGRLQLATVKDRLGTGAAQLLQVQRPVAENGLHAQSFGFWTLLGMM